MPLFNIASYIFRKELSKQFIVQKCASLKYLQPGPFLRLNHITFTMRLVHQSSKTVKSSPLKPKHRRILKIIGIGFGIGILASSSYMYDVYKKINKPIVNQSMEIENEYFLKDSPPKHSIARSIQNPADGSGLKITLYQFQTCPFCCKVRAFLDYYGFAYDVVEVNSVTHKETKWTTYRKVPFLVIEQQGVETTMQLKDSSMIISALQSFLWNKEQTLEEIIRGYPTMEYINADGEKKRDIMNKYFIMFGGHPPGKSKEDIVYERKWRKWVDDVYVHTLSPNVYRTLDEAFQAFEWFSKAGNWEEHFATWERLLVVYVGSLAMYLIGKRLKKRHGLKDDVRLSFYEETNIWLREVKLRGGKFLGGESPNLSDLGVYGVLTAVEGCDAFKELLLNTKIETWFNNMKRVVDNHEGSKFLKERGPNRC